MNALLKMSTVKKTQQLLELIQELADADIPEAAAHLAVAERLTQVILMDLMARGNRGGTA